MKKELDMLEDGWVDKKSKKYKRLKSSIHAVRVELNRTNTCVTATA